MASVYLNRCDNQLGGSSVDVCTSILDEQSDFRIQDIAFCVCRESFPSILTRLFALVKTTDVGSKCDFAGFVMAVGQFQVGECSYSRLLRICIRESGLGIAQDRTSPVHCTIPSWQDVHYWQLRDFRVRDRDPTATHNST